MLHQRLVSSVGLIPVLSGAERKVDDAITGTGRMAVMGGSEEAIARLSYRDTPVEGERLGMLKL